MEKACVILAAGEGTRMRTRLPKVLHPICGEPMISYPVGLALQRRYHPIVVVCSKRGMAVREYLQRRYKGRVSFAIQDPPIGTGHAVLSARSALGKFRGKLAILYGDMPLLAPADLAALERGGRNSAVAFLSCRMADPAWYGRVLRNERGEVVRIVEYKDASPAERRIQEINTGTYLVDAPFVFDVLRRVRRANAQGEYYLTDLIEATHRLGRKVQGVARDEMDNFLGVNDRGELSRAEAVMNRRIASRLMHAGVTVLDPATTWLGPDVRVGADSVILPGCVIQGKVRTGSGCRIGPGAVIRDAWIGSDVEVKAYSVLEDCEVGDGAQVGPFARLRPGTRLAAEVRIGNFVEVKKSRLGRGSKANHLTYLGDTTIGAGVNVGAGTITCNYDGVNKFPTVIEDGVFIGSDTQLVAPVKVGKNAVIGAGTTVTQDVPPGALAVSRVKQRNIHGYASRKKSKAPRHHH